MRETFQLEDNLGTRGLSSGVALISGAHLAAHLLSKNW